jgi:hypothetical protein
VFFSVVMIRMRSNSLSDRCDSSYRRSSSNWPFNKKISYDFYLLIVRIYSFY